MMGHQEGFQPKLFYHQINLEQRVPKDDTLRKFTLRKFLDKKSRP